MDFVQRPFKLGGGDPMSATLAAFNRQFGDVSAFIPLLANEARSAGASASSRPSAV